MQKVVYRGATDLLKFTVIEKETGTALDLTGEAVDARLVKSDSEFDFLSDGFSSGSVFPGDITITTPANGEISIQLAVGDTRTAPVGLYDLHLSVNNVASGSDHKYIGVNFMELRSHAI